MSTDSSAHVTQLSDVKGL